MFGKAMLALALFLGPAAVRAMPGNVCADISPTSPNADNPIDPRSESTNRSQLTALRIPALLREACVP